jgi:hypothetical protein
MNQKGRIMGERSVFGTVLTFLLICLVGAAELLLVSGCQSLIGDSPEQAFERLKKAAEEKNWPAALAMLEKQSQQELVAAYWAVLAIGSLGDEKARNILQQHQVPIESVVGPALFGIVAGKLEPEKIAQEIAGRMTQIADWPSFLREAQSWAEEKGLGEKSFLAQVRRVQLKSVQVAGQTATAELTEPILLNQTRVEFRKVDGRWLVSF